jgi:Spy/CpxP family protein refolding chaperone
MWWNQERPVAALGLREEQRQGMDGDLAACLETRREQLQRYALQRREMADALAAGDWDEARAKAAAADSALLAAGEAETELTIAVVRRLSETQRAQLRELFPRLLARRWLVGGTRSAMRVGLSGRRTGGAGEGN